MVDLKKFEENINKLNSKRRYHITPGMMDQYTALEASITDMRTDFINARVLKEQTSLMQKTIKKQLELNSSEQEMVSFYVDVLKIMKNTDVNLDNLKILDGRFGEIDFMKELCREDASMFKFVDSSLKKDKIFIYELLNEGIKVDFNQVDDKLKENKDFKLALVETFCNIEEGKDFDKKLLLEDKDAIFKAIASTGQPKLDLQDFIELAKEEKYYDDSIKIKAEHFEL